MKQYEVIELIADVSRTEDGIQGVWNTSHALNVLNAKAKEGWEFKFLIPDERGRCIVERKIGGDITNEVMILQKINNQFEILLNKKWWQFWK